MPDRHRSTSASPFEDRYRFSRAVRDGRRVIVAGTAPIPPDGGPPPADAYEQMLLCGEIVASALADLGAGLEDVVRTRMYIVDPADADEVGRGHAGVFGGARPAATMVVVAALLDPAWKVEIEAEAIVPD